MYALNKPHKDRTGKAKCENPKITFLHYITGIINREFQMIAPEINKAAKDSEAWERQLHKLH